MSDATLIADLIRAGVDPELVARVSNALVEIAVSGGNRVDKTIEKRRAWDREYRRSKRSIPPDIHPNPPDIEVGHIDTSLSFLPSVLEKKIKKVRKKVSIPPEWTLSDSGLDYAASKGWTTEYAHSEALRFRDHFLASGATKLDWEATWRNWVTSPYQKPNARGSPAGNPPRPGSREDRSERTHHALNKLRSFANGAHADDARAGGDARVSDVRLLPFDKPP